MKKMTIRKHSVGEVISESGDAMGPKIASKDWTDEDAKQLEEELRTDDQ